MAMKQLPEDFKDFIKFLNELDVRYILVGGRSVGIYGNPRPTKDIDFLTVFNIGGNNYRLVAFIVYSNKRIYIRHILTHSEYNKDKWQTNTSGSLELLKLRRALVPPDAQSDRPANPFYYSILF